MICFGYVGKSRKQFQVFFYMPRFIINTYLSLNCDISNCKEILNLKSRKSDITNFENKVCIGVIGVYKTNKL